jgi:exo-beta-1,3-glucanase (GH17 family)
MNKQDRGAARPAQPASQNKAAGRAFFQPRAAHPAQRWGPVAALTLVAAATLGGCGGGIDAGGSTPSPLSLSDRRPLSAEFTSRTAVSYSPYRSSTSESDLGREVITAANVLQDLRLINASGIGMIRLFSSRGFAETVLTVIRDNNLNMKVMLGAYVNPATSAVAEADNQAELTKAIALANSHRGTVEAVSVGNETMVEWSSHKVDVAVMARYLLQVRSAIRQPVTTDDNWLFWASVPKAIANVVDFAAVHSYPILDTFYDPLLWDWRFKSTAANQRPAAMVAGAVTEAKRQFGKAREAFDKLNLPGFPMVIGETGWTARDAGGGPVLNFRAHPVNQKMYFDALQAWAIEGRNSVHGPKAMFYFQAFDEPWKQGDDGWGLFNKDRQARYTVQSLGTCGVTWVCEAGGLTAADAVSWVAPTVASPVTANRYTLYSEAEVPGEVRPTGLRWDPFALTGYANTTATAASGDGNTSFEITPNPVNFGWGLFTYSAAGVTDNLSAYAGGRLNFSVKSDSYPGKIEVGISTDTEDRDVQEAYVRVGPGDFGYCNTNAWCTVSIPVSAFLAANPKLDLRMVSFRFIIADRYSFTGKPPNTTGLPKLYVDGIHWAK